MAKGYWIAQAGIGDAEACKGCVAANAVAFAKYHGRFIVGGGPFENPEGKPRSRGVVIEFPSYQAALACYHSAEYAPAIAIRQTCAKAGVSIIGGYGGVQPGGA